MKIFSVYNYNSYCDEYTLEYFCKREDAENYRRDLIDKGWFGDQIHIYEENVHEKYGREERRDLVFRQ